MKSNLFLFLIGLFTYQVSAQVDAENGKPYFGVRGGANMANLTKSDGDTRTDVYLGGFINLKGTSMYSIQLELDYSRQGAVNVLERQSLNSYTISDFYKTDINVNYIDLKLVNKFQLQDVNLVLGGGVGTLLNRTPGKYNNTDILFTIGIGYDITDNIGVEARWKHGLKTINKSIKNNDNTYSTEPTGKYYYYYEDNIKNSVFQLGVYYKF